LSHISKLSLGTCLSYLAVIFIFPAPVLHIFTEQPSLVAESIPLLRIVIVAIVVYSVSGIVMTGVISTGAGTTAALIEVGGVITYLVYIYTTAVVWKASLPTVWLCEIIYMVLMLVPCVLYLQLGNWRSVSRRLQVGAASST
jgi:Na+-driven multidrug efflux pump